MSNAVLVRAVKTVAEGADRLRSDRSGVVVLLYHRVGAGTGVQVDLPVDLFTRQMEVLAQSGRVVTLDQALAVLAGTAPSPTFDPVVVTFDDGTADFADVAVPIMADHAIPSTLYLATDFVERATPFPNQGTPLSWSAVIDVMATGLVSVGSHTHTHVLLDRADIACVEDELDRSVGLIEDRLACPAQHFAYPKAVLGSPSAEVAVRRRFRSAALAGTRPNPYGRTDPHRLRRSAIQVADGMRWFNRKLEGGMALEDLLRRVANRRRYAGAVN
ncbi:polysaccharide deacetylase family protein [soil metagenome]